MELCLLTTALRPPADLQSRMSGFDPALAGYLEALGDARLRLALAGVEFEIGFHATPLDAIVLASAVDHAPYPAAVKAAARAHRAHWSVCLQTASAPWLARCGLLLAVVGALAQTQDSIAVVHCAARASLPAAALIPDGGERLQVLQAYPLGLLITGFQKYEIEGEPGVWMASVAAQALGLPEFAMWAPDHTHAQATLELYDQLHRHLLQSAAVFRPGDRISAGQQELRVAALPPDLPFARGDRHWLQLVPT